MIGTYGGLSRLRNGVFTSYRAPDALGSNHVRALYRDPDGVLWIGTYDGGLSRFAAGRFTTRIQPFGIGMSITRLRRLRTEQWTESGGSGSVTNTHTYTTAGVYPVKITITDKDGAATSSALEYVVVYDPHEGFVMGRGWLDSPAGALVSQPRLSGRVHFGFISRYRKRTDVPKGETHFHFRVGSFRFESRHYEWLVVDGGLAQYKGTGKVNGTSGYTFLLTAADGGGPGGDRVDRMRLRVWNTRDGRSRLRQHDRQSGDAGVE